MMTSSSTVMASSLAVRVDRIWESERPVEENGGGGVRGQVGAGEASTRSPLCINELTYENILQLPEQN